MGKARGGRNPPLFQVPDYWGNLVTLHEATWNIHILDPADGHPQMVGCEKLVQQLLLDPLEIRLGAVPESAVFVSDPGVGPSPEGMRAVVLYNNVAFEMGAFSGIVTTAYPIDLVRYPTPRIGRILAKRSR